VSDPAPPTTLRGTWETLLSAASFAARAHRHQIRKDRDTPYVAHVFRVCLITRHVFGIDDTEVLMATLLHDTIEDTSTDYDDLLERFGRTVTDSVIFLTKDTRKPEGLREESYADQLRHAPWPVKVAKLADIFDNLIDSRALSKNARTSTVEKIKFYLTALEDNLPLEGQNAMSIVRRLVIETENEMAS